MATRLRVMDRRNVEADEVLVPLKEDAIRTLVDNHRQFRTFLKKRLGNEADAEEVLQLSLKKALERPLNSEREESVVAWFYTILRNALTDHFRLQASEKKKRADYETELTIERGSNVFAELETEVCKCMRGLLPTLKPGYAQLLERIDLEGQSPELVAKDLGLTRGNVDVKLHRAREALKKSLERSCGTCTEHGCLNCTCG